MLPPTLLDSKEDANQKLGVVVGHLELHRRVPTEPSRDAGLRPLVQNRWAFRQFLEKLCPGCLAALVFALEVPLQTNLLPKPQEQWIVGLQRLAAIQSSCLQLPAPLTFLPRPIRDVLPEETVDDVSSPACSPDCIPHVVRPSVVVVHDGHGAQARFAQGQVVECTPLDLMLVHTEHDRRRGRV